MKKISLLSMLMVLTLSVFSQDMVVLKSGKRYMGSVTEKDGEVVLRTSLGIVKYPLGSVEVVKNVSSVETMTEYKGAPLASQVENPTPIGNIQVELNSGRKIRGEFYSLNGQYYLKEGAAMIMINDFVIKDAQTIGVKKVKGDIISGEKCLVTLNSGRIFAGLIEEKEGGLMVTSRLGSVMIHSKNLEKIERTGELLDLKEDGKNLEAKPALIATEVPNEPSARGASDKRVTVFKDPNIIDQEELDRKIQKSLDKTKEKKKVITNTFDFY